MNSVFVQQMGHNDTALQQYSFHQLSGTGLECTLLQQYSDKRDCIGESIAV